MDQFVKANLPFYHKNISNTPEDVVHPPPADHGTGWLARALGTWPQLLLTAKQREQLFYLLSSIETFTIKSRGHQDGLTVFYTTISWATIILNKLERRKTTSVYVYTALMIKNRWYEAASHYSNTDTLAGRKYSLHSLRAGRKFPCYPQVGRKFSQISMSRGGGQIICALAESGKKFLPARRDLQVQLATNLQHGEVCFWII